jgi:hypothetical protein
MSSIHKTTPYFKVKCTKYKASDDAARYAKSIPDSTLPPRDLVLFCQPVPAIHPPFCPDPDNFCCQEWLLIALSKVEELTTPSAGSDVAVCGWLGPGMGHWISRHQELYCTLGSWVMMGRKGVLERMSFGGHGRGLHPLLERWCRWCCRYSSELLEEASV